MSVLPWDASRELIYPAVSCWRKYLKEMKVKETWSHYCKRMDDLTIKNNNKKIRQLAKLNKKDAYHVGRSKMRSNRTKCRQKLKKAVVN